MAFFNESDWWVCNVESDSKSDKIEKREYTNKEYEWMQPQNFKIFSVRI